MLLTVKNDIVFDQVTPLLPEATERLAQLSGVFSHDEISKIVENLAADDENLAVAMGSLHENMPLNEFIVKHVDSKGKMTKSKDLKTRQRQAFQTTGLSKSARRQIARKAAKTKRANPTTQIKAQKKTKRAKQKRKSMYGLTT